MCREVDFSVFLTAAKSLMKLYIRPIAMWWHGMANATSEQHDASFLPSLRNILQSFIVAILLLQQKSDVLKFYLSSTLVFVTFYKVQSFPAHTPSILL